MCYKARVGMTLASNFAFGALDFYALFVLKVFNAPEQKCQKTREKILRAPDGASP